MRPILALRHVEHESMGTLEKIFRDAGLVYNYLNLFQETPRMLDPSQLAGLIVLGGPMNVDETERYPFLKHELNWIRNAVDCGVPVLGICLGSQLIAKALGGRVFANGVKEIGWYEVDTTTEAAGDALFGEFGASACVFQWHGDTFELPPGAVQLARSKQCEQQAFRYGDTVWGVQFHAEVTDEMVECWLNEPNGCREVAELDYVDPQTIRDRMPGELPGMHALGERMFGKFATLCQARSNGG